MTKTIYYVVKNNMDVGTDGFYKGKLLGTHPSREDIYTNIVLYEGTNAKRANEIFRKNYKGDFFVNNPLIYKGEGKTDWIVIHKVRP